MKIAIGSDHGGFALKARLVAYLKSKGYEVNDLGTYDSASCDYPDFGIAVGEAVASGEAERGIVVCTTGIGISIAANKVRGVLCALCTDTRMAEMSRRHNNANVLALGASVIDGQLAEQIADVWLNTAFEGGRHERRVNKILDYQKRH